MDGEGERRLSGELTRRWGVSVRGQLAGVAVAVAVALVGTVSWVTASRVGRLVQVWFVRGQAYEVAMATTNEVSHETV